MYLLISKHSNTTHTNCLLTLSVSISISHRIHKLFTSLCISKAYLLLSKHSKWSPGPSTATFAAIDGPPDLVWLPKMVCLATSGPPGFSILHRWNEYENTPWHCQTVPQLTDYSDYRPL